MTPYRITADGLTIALLVTPKARREGIGRAVQRPDGTRLEVAVNAPPEDGRANAAVIALVAKSLGVAKRQVTVLQGSQDRRKLVRVAGDGAALAARLQALIGDPPDGSGR